MEKLPPIEKVFEAWTAIADGRISLSEHHAEVTSSDGAKTYIVRFNGDKYSSDDNGTYWQGYAGYPVLAVMMMQGRLPLDKLQVNEWRDVNWKQINTRFRNNYAKATEEIARERNIDLTASYHAAEAVLDALKQMKIEIKRKFLS